MKFPIKNFFSKYDQIRRKLWNLITFSEKILNYKLPFLCSASTAGSEQLWNFYSTIYNFFFIIIGFSSPIVCSAECIKWKSWIKVILFDWIIQYFKSLFISNFFIMVGLQKMFFFLCQFLLQILLITIEHIKTISSPFYGRYLYNCNGAKSKLLLWCFFFLIFTCNDCSAQSRSLHIIFCIFLHYIQRI